MKVDGIFLLTIAAWIGLSTGFVPTTVLPLRSSISLKLSDEKNDELGDALESEPADGDEQRGEQAQIGTVKIDDGGSDLTDRFKYKVNALMGTFDPANGDDDERQDGNILNAMLTFPIQFTFNAVGRTSGDAELKEKYIEEVKRVVGDMSGDTEGLIVQVTPRGKSFTRLAVLARVDSHVIINSIFDALDELEMTVMRY